MATKQHRVDVPDIFKTIGEHVTVNNGQPLVRYLINRSIRDKIRLTPGPWLLSAREALYAMLGGCAKVQGSVYRFWYTRTIGNATHTIYNLVRYEIHTPFWSHDHTKWQVFHTAMAQVMQYLTMSTGVAHDYCLDSFFEPEDIWDEEEYSMWMLQQRQLNTIDLTNDSE